MTPTTAAPSAPTASASIPTTTERAAAGRCGNARSPPISAGPCRAPARPWSCGAVEGGCNDADQGRLSRNELEPRRPRWREPRLLQALRRAQLPPAGLRGLQAAALSADHRLPL